MNDGPSRKKPNAGDAGYVCSLKTSFGRCVVYDRQSGGDWIDADTRWVVAAYDAQGGEIDLLECDTQRIARQTMKDARDGSHDWIQGDAPDAGDGTGRVGAVEGDPEPVGEIHGIAAYRITFGAPCVNEDVHSVSVYRDGAPVGSLVRSVTRLHGHRETTTLLGQWGYGSLLTRKLGRQHHENDLAAMMAHTLADLTGHGGRVTDAPELAATGTRA